MPKAGMSGVRRRKARQPGKPKRASSAYFYFLSHLREEMKQQGKSIKIGDLAKEAAVKWNGMDEETRMPFEERAAADRKRYEKEMTIFKPPRDPNKPKRPSTAYFHFMADFRAKMKGSDISHKDVIRQAGQAWQRLTEEQKKPYLEKQHAQQSEYDKAMEIYRRSLIVNPIQQRPHQEATGSQPVNGMASYATDQAHHSNQSTHDFCF